MDIPEFKSCDIDSPFAIKSVIEHVVRGVIGASALGFAIYFSDTHPFALIPLGLIALFAFRGCPTCWTLGLIETIGRGAKHQD